MNNLFKSLSTFMDEADLAYQSDQYENLNKAFIHLNKLYEELADKTDVEELAEEVILDQKTKRLMNILDKVEQRKLAIENIKDRDEERIYHCNVSMKSVISQQSEVIRLLENYILIDSNLI
tara:strand:- start:2352 stop:2714 length:363 start_codon:yes stop_codon:yes gene_type:complete